MLCLFCSLNGVGWLDGGATLGRAHLHLKGCWTEICHRQVTESFTHSIVAYCQQLDAIKIVQPLFAGMPPSWQPRYGSLRLPWVSSGEMGGVGGRILHMGGREQSGMPAGQRRFLEGCREVLGRQKRSSEGEVLG